MKKRLLLALLTICNISLLQAADVGYATSAFSTDVQVEIVNKLMEEEPCGGKGKEKAQKEKFVHILRDGKELVDPFDVDLLNESKTFKDILEDVKDYKDFSLEEYIEGFLEGLNDKKITLLIDALRRNREEKAASFVADLSQSDVTWLMDKSTHWNIASIQAACVKQLACNLVNLDLDRLSSDYGLMIADVCNMTKVYGAIAKKMPQGGLCSEIFTANEGEYICSAAYNGNETKLLIGTNERIVLRDINTEERDINTEEVDQPFTANDDEHIQSVAYNGETKLLIRTSRRVVIQDIETGDEYQPFAANAGECISSVAYNGDETQLLIAICSEQGMWPLSGCVVIKDINTGVEDRLFTCNANERIYPVAYSSDETKLLIRTGERIVIIKDIKTGVEDLRFTCNFDERIYSVAYNSDETKLLISTGKRIVIKAIKAGVKDRIFTCNANGRIFSVTYNSDETKLLISKGENSYNSSFRGIVIKDIKTGVEDRLFTCNANERISSVTYNSDETKLLIGTDDTSYNSSFPGIVIKDIKTEVEDRLFTCNADECIYSVAYNSDEAKLLIGICNIGDHVLDRRIVIYDLLNGLDIEQKQLLFRASESWQQDEPYSIGNDELEIYRSLLDRLKKPELFDLEKAIL